MDQEPDQGSYHAHPYIPAPNDPTYAPPLVIPRPFRLCDVSPADRATWCMQAAFELATLRSEAFHLGTAYDKACTIAEKQYLLTSIITMNSKGRSTLAAILEALVGLERSVWSVYIAEEMENDLANVVRFDVHCRARLVALNMHMDAVVAAATQQSIAEALRVPMAENPHHQPGAPAGVPESADIGSTVPEQEVQRGFMQTDEAGSTVDAMEATEPANVSASNDRHADTESISDLTQSEAATEECAPRSLQRPQFGSMTLAEAEDYSSWRGSQSA